MRQLMRRSGVCSFRKAIDLKLDDAAPDYLLESQINMRLLRRFAKPFWSIWNGVDQSLLDTIRQTPIQE